MKIKIEGNPKFLEIFQQEFEKESETALRDSVGIQQAKVRESLTNKKIIDTGNLRQSIQQSISFSRNKGLGVVGTNSIYALPMELGIQKRFFPNYEMIKSLRRWAIRKLGLSGKEAFKAGAAIAWKIARKGLDKSRFPSNFFSEGYNSSLPAIARTFQMHLDRAAQRTKSRVGS